MPRIFPLALAAAAALALAACSDDDDNGPSDDTTRDFITAVSTTLNEDVPVVRSGPPQFRHGTWAKGASFDRLVASLSMPPVQVTAVYHDGQPPAATGGLETIGELLSTPLVGLPFLYGVAASGAFTIVYLQVEGTDGYYQLTLPSGMTSLELAVTLANTPPSAQFELQALLGYSGGVSQPIVVVLEPGDLSEGDVAVILTWTGQSDMDLHVIDALGQRIYWGNPQTPEGGRLDLDSNPECFIDNVNQEIISWPANAAPHGEYTVILDYYDDCGVASSPYSVRIARQGHSIQNFQGTFSGAAGSQNPEREVTTFDFP